MTMLYYSYFLNKHVCLVSLYHHQVNSEPLLVVCWPGGSTDMLMIPAAHDKDDLTLDAME